jgi:hypothetical protein
MTDFLVDALYWLKEQGETYAELRNIPLFVHLRENNDMEGMLDDWIEEDGFEEVSRDLNEIVGIVRSLASS